jgi:hypothetical protein
MRRKPIWFAVFAAASMVVKTRQPPRCRSITSVSLLPEAYQVKMVACAHRGRDDQGFGEAPRSNTVLASRSCTIKSLI